MPDADRLHDRWNTRDFPVVVAVARELDEGTRVVSATDVATSLEMDFLDVVTAMRALVPGYLVGRPVDSLAGTSEFFINQLTERGRRAVGIWPSGEGVDALVDALRQAEEATDDPEEKGILRRASGAVGMVSRDIMVDVVAAVVTKQSGIG